MKYTTAPNGMLYYHENGEVILSSVDRSTTGSVAIPDTITTIPRHAFDGCHHITSIDIPESVVKISAKAFEECTRLEKFTVSLRNPKYESDDDGVLYTKNKKALLRAPIKLGGFYVIPNGVKRLEESAFRACKSVTTLILPDSLVHIGQDAFRGCNGLFHITIPKHVTHIGKNAFYECELLSKITVDSDNKYFSNDTKNVLFNQNKTKLIYAPTTISGHYDVPNGVTHIENRAFAKHKRLAGVSFPSSLTTIQGNAFAECSRLATVNFSDGVSYIRERSFTKCTSLRSVTLPNTVAILGSQCFSKCDNLQHVSLGQQLRTIGHETFTECPSLIDITVSKDNLHYSNDDAGVLLNKEQTRIFYAPVNLSERYILPDSVIHVDEPAFKYCTDLKEVFVSIHAPRHIWRNIDCHSQITKKHLRDVNGIIYEKDTLDIVHVWNQIVTADILSGVTTIPSRAFAGRTTLTNVFIPSSVNEIGLHAFTGCANLAIIQVDPNNKKVFNDKQGAVLQITNKNIVLERIPTILEGCYTVPDNTTHIASAAFEDCTLLTDVIIPESVWSIQDQAFINCPGITIHGIKGSEAEIYAKKQHLPFVPI